MSVKQERIKNWTILFLEIAVCAVILFAAWRRVRADLARQNEKAVRDAVLNSATECYAVEGTYPVDISYLEDHYGLVIDHDRYIISYDSFSDNLMPDVKVLYRGEE